MKMKKNQLKIERIDLGIDLSGGEIFCYCLHLGLHPRRSVKMLWFTSSLHVLKSNCNQVVPHDIPKYCGFIGIIRH